MFRICQQGGSGGVLRLGGKGGGRADNAQAKFDSIENMKLFTDAAEKILR